MSCGRKRTPGSTSVWNCAEGQAIIGEALPRADKDDRETLEAAIAIVDEGTQAAAVRRLLGDDLAAAMQRVRSRAGAATYDRELEVVVDRVEARYAAWYAFLPRSTGRAPGRGATFAEAAERLPGDRGDGL